ncbi:leucine Rich repeat-containing domain protein [Ancylostoma caninum]|uniref:Leucine Rich repeat-containing domain protein n=1 Tax=Ancylostoma caninum TaxID=29170 RepID=A0A368FB08_ANCCA|nr:leucine Rich repeat-containing domain protein [Ancylostoma caninum]
MLIPSRFEEKPRRRARISTSSCSDRLFLGVTVEKCTETCKFCPIEEKGICYNGIGPGKSIVLLFAGDFLGAQNALFECLLHHRSSLMADDAELLDARVVFMYKFFHRLDRTRSPDCSRTERRKMYELIADAFCSYGGDRKEVLEHAIKYYKLMFQHSVSDREKCSAAISVAQTLMDLESFDDAIEWFEKVLEFERAIGKSDIKLLQTQVLIFEAKCRRKFATRTSLLSDFDVLNSKIPDESPSLKASIYRAIGQFFASNGDQEASVYLGRAKRLSSETDAVESGEEEECEETSDELEARPDKAILRECMEVARLRNSDIEIEKDRDKEKNAHGETRLHIAARSNDTGMVDKLIAAGYDVNRRDYGGWTPISEAVSAGMRDNVRALLKAGAKVDPVSTEVLNDDENSTGGGITPLMEACDKGFVEIARDLLKCGASVTKRNADGWTAVDFLRNLIVSCGDEDDENYVKDLTMLAQFMEDMQRKQSFPVRGCAPQRRKSLRTKPPLKTFRPNPLDEEDDLGLSSYKRVIGGLGAQSTKRSRTPLPLDETALFYEDDVVVRNPPIDDDVLLPSDCERSPVKSRTQWLDTSRRSSRCASPLSVSSSNSPMKARTSNSRFAPLPIDDGFIIDDEPKRRKRKPHTTQNMSTENVKRRSKVKSTLPLSSTQVSPARFDRSPSPELVIRRSQPRHLRESVPSRGSSPVTFSLESRSPPVSNISPTATQGIIIATLKFEDDTGAVLRPDKLVTFPRVATMANAEERLRSELPQPHQTKSFDVRLGDGREADAEIPLISLGEPLVIVCRLRKPTAEVFYKSRGGAAREDVMKSLSNFEKTGELDLSSSESGDKNLVELVLNAAIDTKRNVASLCLDGCDITDGVLSSLTIILQNVTKFSCRYAGLNDEQLSSLNKTSSLLSITTIDLSHNELTSGFTLSSMLSRCHQISELHICDLDIELGHEALVNAISGLHGLRVLDISFSNWLKGNYAENVLSSCESLTNLILDGSDLRGLCFESTWLPNLRELSMVGCQLTEFDSLIEWMSMGCVQKLDLSGTELTLNHLRTLVEARMMCPPIVVRLARARAIERDPQAFVDMILAFVSERTFPIRFHFSARFANAVRTMTAFASNFLCS